MELYLRDRGDLPLLWEGPREDAVLQALGDLLEDWFLPVEIQFHSSLLPWLISQVTNYNTIIPLPLPFVKGEFYFTGP